MPLAYGERSGDCLELPPRLGMIWPAALLPALLRRRCSGPTAGHQGEYAADAAAMQEEDVEAGKVWKRRRRTKTTTCR